MCVLCTEVVSAISWISVAAGDGLLIMGESLLITPHLDFKTGGGSHTIHVLRSTIPHPELPTQPAEKRPETR